MPGFLSFVTRGGSLGKPSLSLIRLLRASPLAPATLHVTCCRCNSSQRKKKNIPKRNFYPDIFPEKFEQLKIDDFAQDIQDPIVFTHTIPDVVSERPEELEKLLVAEQNNLLSIKSVRKLLKGTDPSNATPYSAKESFGEQVEQSDVSSVGEGVGDEAQELDYSFYSTFSERGEEEIEEAELSGSSHGLFVEELRKLVGRDPYKKIEGSIDNAFAIVQLGGHQYKVTPGDIVISQKLLCDIGVLFSFSFPAAHFQTPQTHSLTPSVFTSYYPCNTMKTELPT